MISATPTIPPTTPPAIAPAELWDFLDVEGAEAVGELVAEDDPLVCVGFADGEFDRVTFDRHETSQFCKAPAVHGFGKIGASFRAMK